MDFPGTGMTGDGMYEDGMSELFGSHLEPSRPDRHFLRIPIKNVVSLDRRFGVSMPMTSNFTLYLWPFHLRKHLKDPISLIKLLSKF